MNFHIIIFGSSNWIISTKNERVKAHTHCSGLIFLSQGDFKASSAVILLSGSNSNILSKRSNAEAGINTKSSRKRLLCSLFGFRVWNSGSLITDGQTAGVGVPHTLDILSSCIISALACET